MCYRDILCLKANSRFKVYKLAHAQWWGIVHVRDCSMADSNRVHRLRDLLSQAVCDEGER